MRKQNFKTMVILLTATLLLVTGCGANNNASEQANTLTEADARRIALEKAGLETATFTKQEYDAEDVDFEFEFHVDGKEYECEISAKDGTIKNYDVENISGSSDILD